MKISATNILLPSAIPEIKITNRDESEELIFSASCFGRATFNQSFDIFEHINKYWASLPENEQDHIFSLYKDISVLFTTVWERTALTVQLSHKVAELLDYHDFEKVYRWVQYKADTHVPEIFEKEYQHSIDRQGSREQTYIRSDYTKLIALALVLRTAIPIWGEYISHTRQETGTVWKEYYAFMLINHAKILHSEPYDKLRTYIEHTVGDDCANPSTIIEGISSEDFPTWMLSLVSIRRLCVGDIRGIDPRANLVTYIYKYITQKMKGSDITAENMVKPKLYDEGGSDLDAKLSALERYKIKHNISLGEIVELEFSINDVRSIANRLTANMTDELLARSIESASRLYQHRLLDPQMMLLRWIFKPVISPRGIMYLSKETIVRLFGVLQAVLWARGHKYLAMLSTSHANIVEGEINVSSIDSRARIPKELQAELDVLYPFHKIVGGKKTGQRPINLTIKSIETLADNLSMFSWNMTADEQLIAEAMGSCTTRRIPITYDIKIQLANLVAEIGRRTWI